ncbi:hypothetical protein RDV89_09515 [Nocardioides zeae]|uniref:Uncharacterized protein n=1 Tax=Nocardioides imazamoxiresistens TaxID=3231893 RepID=A0ABU3PVN6_9ACTN|nr:hypothetical protein [Nocardioides zeae]MDT9593304.1 hypothetical protein [Nocardioides zeae]
MRIVIDHAQVPPRTELVDPEDFSAFSVRISVPHHTWVDRDVLVELAGEVVDRAWLDRLDGMIAYAERHGWVDDSGRVRAHLEVATEATAQTDSDAG